MAAVAGAGAFAVGGVSSACGKGGRALCACAIVVAGAPSRRDAPCRHHLVPQRLLLLACDFELDACNRQEWRAVAACRFGSCCSFRLLRTLLCGLRLPRQVHVGFCPRQVVLVQAVCGCRGRAGLVGRTRNRAFALSWRLCLESIGHGRGERRFRRTCCVWRRLYSLHGVAERVFRKGGTALETLLPLVIVYALYSFSGEDVAMRWKRHFNGEERKVALVQRNFPCVFDESAAENPDEVYSNLLANVSLLMPDLVVLPESAMAEFGRVNGANAHIFAENVRRQTGATEVIAGGTRVERGDNWLPKVYNSAALYTEDRTLFYDKVHLVPFGEFIPFDKTFPALQRFAPVGSCWPGELKLLGDYGVAICYEDTDSAQIRRLAEKGARALVFITNDSWFGGSHEAVQHAWQSTARAIETGLAVVRVGNSGVTGVIAPDGAATWLENSHSRPLTDMRGTMFDRIFLAPKDGKSALAPYVTLGDKPIFIVFSLFILAGFMIKYLKLIRKTKVEEDGIE